MVLKYVINLAVYKGLFPFFFFRMTELKMLVWEYE